MIGDARYISEIRDGFNYRRAREQVMVSVIIPTLDTSTAMYRRCVDSLCATVDSLELLIMDGPASEGFTAKINEGVRRARGDYIVSSNDDVEVLEGWWEPLKAALDAGASVAYPLTVEGFMRWDLPAWHYAFTRRTVDRFNVGGDWLDPSMRLTYSDTDLLQRLRVAGSPPVFVPGSRIRHGLSRTLRTIDYTAQETQDKAAYLAKWPAGSGLG